MKYVVSWSPRSFASVAEQEAAVNRMLKAYSKWTPPKSVTYHQFLATLDARKGYQVVETDSPADLAETIAKFAPFFDFQLEPVMDVADGVKLLQAGIKFRESIK